MMNGLKRSWEDMDTTALMDSFTATFGDASHGHGHGQDQDRDHMHGNNSNNSNNSNITTTTDGTRLDDNASAASRQKSCNACVRGKRRCDKRTPQCSRCSAKGLDCVYQKLPPGASTGPCSSAAESARPLGSMSSSCSAGLAGDASTMGSTCATAPTLPTIATASTISTISTISTVPPVSSSAASTASCVSDVPDFDMGFDIDSLGTDTSPESLQADVGLPPLGTSGNGTGPGGLDFSIVDLMAQSAGGEHDIWNLHPFAETTADKLQVPPVPTGLSAMAPPSMHSQQQRQPIRDLSLVKDLDACIEIDPLAVHDPGSRLGHTVGFLTSMHSTFSHTRALPFMHPRLWSGQLPKAILAAFSASAAYGVCSPSNKGWTVRLLIDAGREIHREGERAVTNEDKLSRVQALLILNSMRIFDGDLGLRAAAEREVPVMMSWLKDLASVKETLELEEGIRGTSGFARDTPPKSWESWIFLESSRRTLLTSYAITCLMYMLKSEAPDDEMWCQENNFTASRHLWDAPNSVEFYRAWREKPQFIIQNMSFKDFWVYARPDDCDDFTKLMLTSQVGVDAMEHFMNGDVTIPVNPGRVP